MSSGGVVVRRAFWRMMFCTVNAVPVCAMGRCLIVFCAGALFCNVFCYDTFKGFYVPELSFMHLPVSA